MDYCKILIVDDELLTRQGIKYMLSWEQEGYKIVGDASNGREALEKVEQLKPDIVLCDIQMPIINGIDFSFIMYEKYPSVQLVMLSSFDDFEYVKKTLLNGAADYLLKPTLNPDILLKTLNKLSKNMAVLNENKKRHQEDRKQFERYLQGYQNEMSETFVKEMFPYMQFCLLAIDLKAACENNRRLIEKVHEWLLDNWENNKKYAYQTATLGEDVVCILFNYLKKDEAELQSDIRLVADNVAQVAEKAFFILSNPYTDISETRKYFEEDVRPCLKLRFHYPGTHLITVNEYDKPSEIQRFEYDHFLEMLSNRLYANALDLLEKYAVYLAGQRYDEYLMKNMIKNLLYNFLMEVESEEVDSEQLRSEYFRKIDETASAEEMLEAIRKMSDSLKMQLANLNMSEDARIQAIKAYIWEHSGEKLELAEIATVFGFNYHYISSYFNQYISEGFSGYLNKIRVDKACVLLKDHKIPIADISGEVGYSNHGYFCRVFKKLTGKTPSQYRRGV